MLSLLAVPLPAELISFFLPSCADLVFGTQTFGSDMDYCCSHPTTQAHNTWTLVQSKSLTGLSQYLLIQYPTLQNAMLFNLCLESLFQNLLEMIFGNYLRLEHRPSGIKCSFTTQESLKNVEKGELVDGDGSVMQINGWRPGRTYPGMFYSNSMILDRRNGPVIPHSNSKDRSHQTLRLDIYHNLSWSFRSRYRL